MVGRWPSGDLLGPVLARPVVDLHLIPLAVDHHSIHQQCCMRRVGSPVFLATRRWLHSELGQL